MSLPGTPLVASGSFFTRVCFKLAAVANLPFTQDGKLASLVWPQFPQVCWERTQAAVKSIVGQGTASMLAEQSWEALLFIQLVLHKLIALELPRQVVTLSERPCW